MPKLEHELVRILFETRNITTTFPHDSPALGQGGLLLVKTWGNEGNFVTWLQAVAASSNQLSAEVALQAGKLLLDNRWQAAARYAKHSDESLRRHDFTLIWKTYYDSLGRFEKLAFDLFSHFASTSPESPKYSAQPHMTDALFVTALPEEFSAVRAHLTDRQERVEKGTLYEIGRFQGSGAIWTVAVVQTGMGNAQSAAATERALSLFNPTFAFFVGIAGGLRDDLAIGDVIAADKVYSYEGGKAADKFKTRPEATNVSHEAVQRANALVRDNQWQKTINPPPKSLPKALIKPIAAGEKVVTSKRSQEFKRLSEVYSDAHAVAMEEHGFCVAVKTHPHICFSVVRGISDLIVNKEESDRAGSHEIAAGNAAAFAFAMLAEMGRARAGTQEEERAFID